MLSDEWLPRYRLLENFTAKWNGNGNGNGNGNAYDRGDYNSSFALRAVELKKIHFYPCYNGWHLLSIDNFLFTLFYAVILHITLNFKFFSMHCCAEDALRMGRMLDENVSSPVVPHFFFSKT